MAKKIDGRIINHLAYARTNDGQVGCRVKAVEDGMNKAWISIVAKKSFDARVEPVLETVVGYEVEYVELSKNYEEEADGYDFDLFLVKKEIFYNLKEIVNVEQIIQRWVDNFSAIEPIANVSYPYY